MDELEPLRLEAIRVLSAAVSEERLPIAQLESRLVLVRQAPNRATLEAIVADVIPTGGFEAPVRAALVAADHTAVVFPPAFAPVEPAEVLRIATIMGSSRRAGSWTVPLRLELRVLLGELTIDLRDAAFCSDVLDVVVHVTLGSLTLIVPIGTQVENECEERFSSSTHSIRPTRGAGHIGLLVRLTGRVQWSSLEIKEKRPSADSSGQGGWRKWLGGGEG